MSEVGEVIGRYVDLTEAYVYFASLENSDERALKILAEKIGKLIAENPDTLIPDMVLSAFVKNDILTDAMQQGEDVQEILNNFLGALMSRLKKAVPERVKSRKEFEAKGNDIINEAVNIIGRIDGTER